MKIKIILTLILGISFIKSYSQDKLFKPDGTKLEVKVLEVNQTEIKYKKWSNQVGPTYTINKNEVMMILYQNGENEVINPSSTIPNNNTLQKENEYGQNMFSINPIHLIFGNITITYEHFNKEGNCSVKFPVSFGYKYANFNFGTEIKLFPSKDGNARYFLGPVIKGGLFPLVDNYDRVYNYAYSSILFINGGSFQPTKGFNITIDGGIGPGYITDGSKKGFFLDYQIGLSLGVRF